MFQVLSMSIFTANDAKISQMCCILIQKREYITMQSFHKKRPSRHLKGNRSLSSFENNYFILFLFIQIKG